MLLFYNIGIRLYGLGVLVASVFNPKAKKWVDGRNALLQKIEQQVGSFNGQTVWVHCASLGEFEMARPIIERLKKEDSNLRIVLTFFSPSGYEVRKNYPTADYVFYLPLDTKSNAKRFVRAIKPDKVIFVKYDLWFHHLNEAKKLGAKMMLISAVFRQSQQYFKFYGVVGRNALKLFDRIFLVDKNSEKLLHQIGIENTTVCGDTRYDRVMQNAASAQSLEKISKFKGSSKLVVCGSTWPEDEQLFVEVVKLIPNTKFVFAPHEIGEENLIRLETLFPNSIRLSEYEPTNANVLIVDSIGLLSSVYQYANVAYVGGGFRNGIHNILEATAYGTPTLFGPNHSRFPDATELHKKSLAQSVTDKEHLLVWIEDFLRNEHSEMRQNLLLFMKERIGATETILEYTKNC